MEPGERGDLPTRPGVRRRAALGALVAILALVAACTSDAAEDGGTSTTTIPPADTVLRVATPEWPTCLEPLTCGSGAATDLVLQHVLPVLMEPTPDGTVVPSPVLVGRPEVLVDEAGAQTITYRLAPEARWHDERPVTSSDVVATWRAVMSTTGADRRGYEHIVSVDDRDPLVAVVTLDRPWADWPQLFGGHDGFLLPADDVAVDLDLAGRFVDEAPTGAGPWELVSFDDDEIVLAARPEHWDEDRRAGIDRVEIVRLDPGERPGPDVDVVLSVEDPGRDGLSARRTPAAEVVGLLLDRRTPALQSAAVRTALDDALDRASLLELVVPEGSERPEPVPCLGWLPAEEACEDVLAATGTDLPAAEAVLDADGWVRGEDGVRRRGGEVLTVPVTHDPGLAGADAVADAVRLSLRALGIEAGSGQVDASAWSDPTRTTATGLSVQSVPLGTPGRVERLYRCPPGAEGPLAWCDPDAQALLDALVAGVDGEEVLAVSRTLGALAAEVRAWLPLGQRSETWWVDAAEVSVPDRQPLGRGPLGALHAFVVER